MNGKGSRRWLQGSQVVVQLAIRQPIPINRDIA